MAYSGTPETARFGERDSGHAVGGQDISAIRPWPRKSVLHSVTAFFDMESCRGAPKPFPHDP